MNDINGMPVRLGWTYKCEQTGQVGRAVQYIRADVVHLLAAYGEPWQAASENLRRIGRRDHVPVPPPAPPREDDMAWLTGCERCGGDPMDPNHDEDCQ